MSSINKYNSKKRSKKFYCNPNKKRKLEGPEPGLRGFLITCNDKKEAPAVSEAYTLLNEYADKLYGPEETIGNEEDSEGEECIEKALSNEINSLKEKSTERRFKSMKTKVKNVLFIKTNLPNPNAIADLLFTDLEKTRQQKSRRCMKFFPVMATCYASLESIKLSSKKIFEDYFNSNHNEATFCIILKSRCNNTVKRDELVPEIATIIQELNEEWKVQYKNPDYTVMVDIIANVCTLAILKDFDRFRKYNLQSMAEQNKTDGNQETEKDKKGKEAKKEQTEEKIVNNETKDNETIGDEVIGRKETIEDKTIPKETIESETKEKETNEYEIIAKDNKKDITEPEIEICANEK